MKGSTTTLAIDWIGILGGTFDPVHLGHLGIAESARQAFSRSRVLLVPCATPPHKPEARLAAERHRVRMLELAIAGREGLVVSRIELERGGISYTVDTLRAVRDDSPSTVGPVFILGMDSLIEIQAWKDHRTLLDEFDLVVVDRPGRRAADLSVEGWIAKRIVDIPQDPGAGAALLRNRSRPGGGIYRLVMEPIDVSSSGVRSLARLGESLDGLVPPSVARYILGERVYLQEEPR